MTTSNRGRPRQKSLVIDSEAKRVGALLKYLREERGVPQGVIAAKIAVSQTTFAHYEAGVNRIPTYDRLVEIVHKLDALAKDGAPRMPDPSVIALPSMYRAELAVVA